MRGPCDACLNKERERVALDRQATPEKLKQHPDLDELELMLEGWYGDGDHDLDERPPPR